MEFEEIDKLIRKYFDGETTLKDEIEIRRFLLESNSLPQKYEQVKEIFLFFDSERQKKSSLQFGDLWPKLKKKKTVYRFVAYSAAASIALVLGIWFFYQSPNEKKVFAYINGKPVENKEVAYKEAQKALMLISKNLNKGTENVKQISEFDKALSMVNKD